MTINIKDKEASILFYGELLALPRLPDFEMDDHRLLYFALPNGVKLELIEYFFETGVEQVPLTAKGIIRHFAFEVEDITLLESKIVLYGGEILQVSKWVEQLGFTGMLVRDPNGCELEFIQMKR